MAKISEADKSKQIIENKGLYLKKGQLYLVSAQILNFMRIGSYKN